MPKKREIDELLQMTRDELEAILVGLTEQGEKIRPMFLNMLDAPVSEQKPKVLQSWATIQGINADKVLIVMRALRDIDAETTDNIREGWSQIEEDPDWESSSG